MRRGVPLVVFCNPIGMVCVPMAACGPCEGLPTDNLWMYVRRRGKQNWIVKYPAWERDDEGRICFMLDNQMPADPGRYEAEIRYEDGTTSTVLGVVEISIPRHARVAGGEVMEAKQVSWYAPPKPEGVTDMYQSIENFSAALCRILEKDDVILPISADDAARLCSLTLCKPAQLVLVDGVHREIVEWRCENGEIVLTRAVAGTIPQRFPRGALIRFEWTEDNVKNAMQGC